jgi:NodT family efflux transporter outer membrane factor (OMF) lipoprotein
MQAPAAFKESPANFQNNNPANPDVKPGPWRVAQPQDAKLRGDWWEIFNEPELNTLEEQLNINNQTIKEYFENFMEARALIREARSQYFPTVTTSPSYNRSRSSGNITNGAQTVSGGTVANAGSTFQLYSIPIDVSWAPDLWGKVRNEVREAEYSAQVSAADLENERLTEQAALAEYYFEIRGQDALIKLYASTVTADEKALQLTQAQYETGVGDKISVVEAQNTLQSAQSSATNLRILRAQYEHAIATLIGKPASDFSIPNRAMTAAPPPIPIGVPSELLERRPDIAAAERAMASVNAEIGVGYAAFYPALTLSATGGAESSLAKHLFDWPSRVWSVGPSISQTIYDGGLYRATLHQYVAIYNADLAAYRQTVLTAFQQVEDQLAAIRILSQQLGVEREAVKAARQAVDVYLNQYRAGTVAFTTVVTAEAILLSDEEAELTVRQNLFLASVSLIEALGGGWDTTLLPTQKELQKGFSLLPQL